jgi:hypothetical protein
MNFGGGFNPGRGADTGHLPPSSGGQAAYGQYPVAPHAYPGIYSVPQVAAAGAIAGLATACLSSMFGLPTDPYLPSTAATGMYAVNPYGPYGQPVAYTPSLTPAVHQLPTWATNQPQGQGGYRRMPHAAPTIDPSMPAVQMTNSTGGVGCEPGYNYFFPRRHVKIHVFTSAMPPWQAPPYCPNLEFTAVHVPANTTLGELLKGFGCNNPTPKNNVVYEIIEGGSGRWYKGLCFSGDMKDAMGKTIAEVGWDHSRVGHGTRPVVCLYFTKD